MTAATPQQTLFIHVPRTVEPEHLTGLNKRISARIHSIDRTAEEYIRQHRLSGHYKFAFKRNPYKRFAGLFAYFRSMDENHPYFRYNQPIVKTVKQYDSLPAFARDFCGLRITRNFHFWPQSDYLLDKHGNVLVDFLGSAETLDSDLARLSAILGQGAKAPAATTGSHPTGDSWGHLEIDDSVIKAVNNHYARDLAMLGYALL
jgi:hypothetical protein